MLLLNMVELLKKPSQVKKMNWRRTILPSFKKLCRGLPPSEMGKQVKKPSGVDCEVVFGGAHLNCVRYTPHNTTSGLDLLLHYRCGPIKTKKI